VISDRLLSLILLSSMLRYFNLRLICKIQLGVAIYKDGDVEGALAAFNSAQESFPDRAEVLNYKGEIYLDQGRHEKGLARWL
jgi:tetratricopeptide (TPR) repeat protein